MKIPKPHAGATDRRRRTREQGNVLFMILITIVILAALARMISQSSEHQSDTLTRQTRDDEINRTLAQAGALGGALQQMTVNGEDPATLYTTLSLLKPGDAGYETAPHNAKIYHPFGGGIAYMASAKPGSAAITSFEINKGSIVTGVGPTDAAVGDILFTALVSSAALCARINEILLNSAAVPEMATATFDDLFTNGLTVTLDGTTCADCVNVPQMCVSNTGATAWGYYAALLPG